MVGAMTVSGTIGWFVVSSRPPIPGLVFWRCLFGALTLLVACGVLGLLARRPDWRIVRLAALGGMAFVLNWVLLSAAFARASISVATVVYNTQPFMLVAMGAFVFGERPAAATLAWLAAAFAGVVLIAAAGPGTATAGGGFGLGIALALGAAFLYAVAAIVARKLAGTPPPLVVLVQLCVGCLMFAPFALRQALPADGAEWARVATMGVLHTGVVGVLLYSAIQRLPTHRVGALSFIYPVVAILVDFLLLGHRLGMVQVLGATLVLLSAAGVTLGWAPGQGRRTCGARTP